jgi:hypothetical protein
MGDEKARLGLAFMYNAPGSLKDQQDKQGDKKEEEKFEFEKSQASSNKNPEKVSILPFKYYSKLIYLNIEFF